MFEKEAVEYADANKVCLVDIDDKGMLQEAYKDGAEFGYKLAHEEIDYLNKHWGNGKDKANEWHYVKDGDLPKKTDEYLVYRISGYVNKSIDIIQYNSSRHFWCVDCQNEVIAWREIVLPKEIE